MTGEICPETNKTLHLSVVYNGELFKSIMAHQGHEIALFKTINAICILCCRKKLSVYKLYYKIHYLMKVNMGMNIEICLRKQLIYLKRSIYKQMADGPSSAC